MARALAPAVLGFPKAGLNVVAARGQQPVGTCVNCLNVRVFDNLEDRARGGIRPGLSQYISNTFEGGGRIQDINWVTLIKDAPPNTTALYIRETRPIAISNGSVQWFGSFGVNTANTLGNSTLSNTAPFILSTGLYGDIYITDGLDYKVWNGETNISVDWPISNTSVLPGDPGNTACRLIETWDGRIVMAGLRTDPNNWFMSAKGDPNDWDYSPQVTTELQAVTGAVGIAGKMDDVINCLIPYSEDILIFGCDHSMWQMSGNPMSGGRLDNISHNIGTPFGRPWCRDPEGNIYFFSNRGDVYMMPPYGAKPKPISEAIHPLLKTTDLNTNFIRMEWDDDAHGCKVWITPFTQGAATHYFFDARTGGWFPTKYANTAYNPIAVKLFDGDGVNDRIVLMGSEDGKIRFANTSTATDDNTAFIATATLGPVSGGGVDQKTLINHMYARTDVNGSATKYEILVGDTGEEAQQSEAATFVGEGSFAAGMSLSVNPMEGGYFSYVKVGTNNATTSWGMDSIHLEVETVVTDPGRIKSS
jgi:hypothetical protein